MLSQKMMLKENKSEDSLSNILDLKIHPVTIESFIIHRKRLYLLLPIALSGILDMLSSIL